MECIFCCQKDNRTSVTIEPTSAPKKDSGGNYNAPADVAKLPVAGQQDVASTNSINKDIYEAKEAKFTEDLSKVILVDKEDEHKQGDAPCNEEFRISLSRERLNQSDLGLDIDSSDGKTLLILKVREGPVKDWNGRSHRDLKVRHLDRITEVNGVSGDSSRLQDIIKAERDLLLLTIKRSKEFNVSLDKNAHGQSAHAKIGLDIVHSGMESLLIKRVKDGMVSDWNQKNPDQTIHVGDRIVQINGKRGDSHKLLDLVANQDKLDVIISRTGGSQ
jgi:hypothetical protein